MQMNSFTPLYIFALGCATAQEEEEKLSAILGQDYGKATGCYEGREERSYIVTAEVWNKHAVDLKSELHSNSQVSVLFLDNQRNAALYAQWDSYNQGDDTQWLGTFREVNQVMIRSLKSWTKVGNTYFTARET